MNVTDESALGQASGDGSFIPAPPPPPPPPGGIAGGIVEKKTGPKTKRLHWKGINRDKTKQTFWENSGYIHFSLNESEMFELFQETNNGLLIDNENDAKNSGLIEFHKMHLTGVIFKKFKWDVKNIVKDIINCTVDDDSIAALLTLFPLDQNELKAIEKFDTEKKNQDDLTLPELFFLTIFRNSLVNTRERLECCAFKNNLHILLTDIRKYTSIIRKACASLRSSKKFASILRIIFKLGTILNKESYLSNAAGFRLDILPKIKDTRTKNGQNLLEYLVKNIVKQKPKLLNFAKEVKYLNDASKISLGSVNQLWNFIETNFKLVKSEIERASISVDSNNEKRNNDVFLKTFSNFINNAEESIGIENKFMQSSFKDFKDTMSYFGEEQDKLDVITTEEFFGNIVRFIDDFNNVVTTKYIKKKTDDKDENNHNTTTMK